MTRLFKPHLPRVGALVLAAALAAVAYSVSQGEPNITQTDAGVRAAPHAGEPGIAALPEGRGGDNDRVPRQDRVSATASLPGDSQQGQLGDRLFGGAGLEPVGVQLPAARPRVPVDRQTSGSPREHGGLLDDPTSPRIPDQKDPLSEVFEPMDEPAAPTPEPMPAAPIGGTPVSAVPATPKPPPTPVAPDDQTAAADPDAGLDDSGLGTLDQTDVGTPVDETDVPEADPVAPVDEADVPEADPVAPVDETDVPSAGSERAVAVAGSGDEAAGSTGDSG